LEENKNRLKKEKKKITWGGGGISGERLDARKHRPVVKTRLGKETKKKRPQKANLGGDYGWHANRRGREGSMRIAKGGKAGKNGERKRASVVTWRNRKAVHTDWRGPGQGIAIRGG